MMTRRLPCILTLAASIFFGSEAQAKPVGRDAFQSSPATYEAPSERFQKFGAENRHLPPNRMRGSILK
jgi:hypothetical protein